MTTHSKTYKMNPEYREATNKSLQNIKRELRQQALKSIPKNWRFVMESDEFCSDDKVWGSFGSGWHQTVNLYNIYSWGISYITSRPLVQSDPAQKTFAEYKAEAEALGLEVNVEHERVYDRFLMITPKGGRTTVSLIAKSGELAGFGEAVCSASDNYCKEKGRLLAIKRAVAEIKGKTSMEEQNSHSCSESATDSAPFKVGDYVCWKIPGGNIVHGPKIIVEIPQPGVIVTDPRWCSNVLDVCQDKIWLAGTPEPSGLLTEKERRVLGIA